MNRKDKTYRSDVGSSLKIDLELMKSVKRWYLAGGSGYPQSVFVGQSAITSGLKAVGRRLGTSGLGMKFCLVFFDVDNNHCFWCVDKDDAIRIADTIFRKPALMHRIDSEFEGLKKKLGAMHSKLGKEGIRRRTVLEDYKRFYALYESFFCRAIYLDHCVLWADHKSEEILRKYPGLRGELNLLLSPQKKVFFQMAELSILKIAFAIRKAGISREADVMKNKRISALLKNHQQDHFWILNSYARAEPLSLQHFTKEAFRCSKDTELMKKIIPLESYERQLRQKQRRAFSRFKLSQQDQKVVERISFNIYWQDQRKKNALISTYWLFEFLKVISDEFKLSLESLRFMLPGEIVVKANEARSGKRVDLRKRENCALIAREDGNYYFYNGKEMESLRSSVFQIPDFTKMDEIIGSSASPGKAKGKVRLILDAQDAQINQGDVLVTFMTRPEFVPLMKKASAVMTEEGGITSHAAIVSRELGIPCVVGAQWATKFFRDGDYVEVDADSGVIKKIGSMENPVDMDDSDGWVFVWSQTPIMYSYCASPMSLRDRKQFKGDSMFSYFDGQVISAYLKKSQLEAFKEYGKHYLDRKFFADYRKEYFKERAEWWRWIRAIEKKDYSKVGPDELINDNTQFMLFMRDSISYFGSTRTEMTFAAEQKLEAILQKRYGDRWIDEFTLFVSPAELDDIQKEHLEWLKLIGKGKPSDDDMLAHVSRYPWLVFGQFSEHEVIKFLREREKNESARYEDEAARLLKDKSDLRTRQSDELKKFGKEKGEIEYLANFLQTQAVERMNIKSYWAGCYYLARNMWKALAKVTGIALVDIFNFLTYEEVNQLIAKKYPGDICKVIPDRRKSFAIIYDGGSGIRVVGNQEADRLFYERIKKHQGEPVSEIKGQTASPGRYKGKVRKVIAGDLDMLKDSIRDFQRGEVLVTSMTQPNMMVIAKKAGAIIADEGGITSHAAIISRELKIPCLVGCLNAMQALDDGDMVEINASGSSGVVRIMGKRNARKESKKKIIKKIIKKDAPRKAAVIATELKGTTINPGLVFGKAKVVKLASDLGKVKTGDILIAKMTTPKFRKAMEKAVAIITDEGDAGCHAEDVSREMSKPCIISTVIATKAFKDGDYIEVDADKGIVRKVTAAEFERKIKTLEKEEKASAVSRVPAETEEFKIRPDMIAWFKDLSKKDLPLVGGKGANLGEMFNHFPIPNGFCITVNAYKNFLKDNKLEEGIFSLLRKLDIEDTKLLDEASVRIEKMIMAGKISGEIEEEIIRDYRSLGSGFVAVRSSATAEDLPTASFAGQQATFLNVKGEKDILVAVKRCWASLFTARAIYYRVINEFHHEKVLISVVVQEMVDSDKAGVMFTANPVNNNRNEMIIEGSFGLGESVVSGQVTPDTYIIEKSPLKMQSKAVNEKKMAIVKDEKTGKNKEITLDSARANMQCLKDSEIIDLAKVGMLIEQHYAKPQDIEWAVDKKGKIFILQSRPITTLSSQ